MLHINNYYILFVVCILCNLLLPPVFSMPCVWNPDLPPSQLEKCGFVCVDHWSHSNPHYCGLPHHCCCAPECRSSIDFGETIPFVGLNWGDHYSKASIPRSHQFQILKDSGFYHIKTFATNALFDIFRVYGKEAFVYVGIPNNQLAKFSNLEYARKAVREQLLPYKEIVKLVIMGNEPLICIRDGEWLAEQQCGGINAPVKLLAAMKTMNRALAMEGMPRRVSTALNGGIVRMDTNPWTPCVSEFKEFLKPLLIPLWEFLRETKSPFIVNVYTWFATLNNAITPKLACGVPDATLPTDGKYNYYFNLDTQMDIIRIAMCKNNITDLELWIGETGYPSAGHIRATLTNSFLYNQNAIRRATGDFLNDEQKDNFRFRGSLFPLFLFEAFDEAKKSEIEHGNQFENHFGLFYENGIPKWRDVNGMIKFGIAGKKDKINQPPIPAELLTV